MIGLKKDNNRKLRELRDELNLKINNNKKNIINDFKLLKKNYNKNDIIGLNNLKELKKNRIYAKNENLLNERKNINKLIINNKNSKTNENLKKIEFNINKINNNNFDLLKYNYKNELNKIKNFEIIEMVNNVKNLTFIQPKLINGKYINNKINFNSIYSLDNKEKLNIVLKNINHDNKYLVKIGNVRYTLSKKNIDKIDNIINEKNILIDKNVRYDDLKEVITNNYDDFELEYLDYSNKIISNKNSGEFFNMHLKDEYNIDLIRYQIYHKNDKLQNEDNCFVNCLKLSNQLSDEQMNSIIVSIKCRDIPLLKIKEIANKYKLNIIIKKYNEHKLTKYLYNENKDIDIINIGLINKHYFLIEEVQYTKYFIKNYLELINEKDNNTIYARRSDNTYKRDDKHFINSYDIIKFLFDNKDKYFDNIIYDNNSLSTQYLNKIDNNIMNIDNLKYEDNNIKLIVDDNESKKEKTLKKYFCDFETNEQYINNTLKHVAYLCCCIDDNDNYNSFYGEDCGLRLLQSLKSDCLLIFHNAKYDFNFILKYMTRTENIIQKDNKLISYTGYYFKYKITIKDSLLLINSPLSNFGKIFGLEQAKEIMPYNLYNNQELFNKVYLSVNDIKPYLNINDYDKFIDNCNKWNLFNNENKINIIEYSAIYCKIDCQVLRNGYNKFNEWCIHGTTLRNEKKINGLNINIDKTLTLASMGYQYVKDNKVFDDVYKFSSIPSLFISRSIRGGRVMSNRNKMIKCDKILNDFDAVSLYPSAMKRLCEEFGGILKGAPKVLETTDYNIIKNYDGYFLKIKISKVNKILDFPLLSVEDKKTKSKNYTNDIVNHEFIVDKITLEDLINFQGVEFEIINGYYFNEGRNNKLGDIIKNLFNTRLALKSDENKAQLLYKEIMNSIYGKTILKPIETETKIISKDELDNFLCRNYNWIKQFEYIDDCNMVKITMYKSILEHYNSPHIGSEILSMSKRIMNEVMVLAQDNNIKIYYQDTDSMHIEDNKVKLLSDLYRNKYNRELIGKNMGEFHCDFDLSYDSTKYQEKTYIDNIVSVKSIFLAKKCYIDKLQGNIYNNNNEIIDTVYGYHCRMKGISSKAIEYYKKINNINEMEIYELLFKCNELEFDLAGNGSITKFKQNKNFSIETIKEFKRNVKFTCKYKKTDFIKY